MRVIYNNLVDDLDASTLTALTVATGYSVLNVQDQRLAYRYVSSSATTQSVLCELDTFPEYPDNATATTYISDFSAGVDGWTAFASSGTLLATQGTMIATIAGIAAYIHLYKVPLLCENKTLIFRTDADSLITSVQYYTGSAYTAITPVVSGTERIYSTYVTPGTAATNIRFYGVSGVSVILNGIYVGDGTYDTVLTDQSGNGNHGTVFGCTPVAGITGRAIQFDGVNDYVNVSQMAFSNLVGVSMLITPTATISANQDFFTKFNTYATGRLTLRRPLATPTQLQIIFSDGAGAIIKSVNSFFEAGVVTHLGLTVDITGATAYLYRNGALFSTIDITGAIAASAMEYVAFGGVSGAFFGGTIDDPRIYNRALEAYEVENLYNQIPWVGEMEGLVGWWKLDKGLGVNTAAVMGHNLLSGTTLKIEGNSSDNWGDPELSEQITVGDNMSLKFLDDTYYYKYWRFSITGQGSIELGRLFLSSYMTIDPSSLLDFKVIKKRSDVVIHGRNRQKFAVEGVGWRRFELSFPRTEEAMIHNIATLYDTVGNHSSFIFCNFDTIRAYNIVEPCYVSIDGEVGFTHTYRMGHTYSLNMEEEM